MHAAVRRGAEIAEGRFQEHRTRGSPPLIAAKRTERVRSEQPMTRSLKTEQEARRKYTNRIVYAKGKEVFSVCEHREDRSFQKLGKLHFAKTNSDVNHSNSS